MTKTTDTSKISKIQPTAGYLLVESKPQEEKTSGGIYLPDNAKQDKPQEAVVVKAGAEEVNDKGVKKSAPAKVGDVVIYKKWGGNEVKIDGKEYIFVKFDDILAVLSS